MIESEKTYTIEQFIESNDDNISYDNLSLLEKDKNNNIIISYNLINEYLNFLKQISVVVELTDKEYLKYMYKPKLLSYDIYGTTELFFIILIINDICNVKDFKFKKFKMIKKKELNNLLSYIYNNEYELINNNRYRLKKEKIQA